MIKLIVGLGNPGKDYENTYHNLGFLCLDTLEKKLGANVCYKNKFKSIIAEVDINGKKVMLAKPQTYMNLSGEAVAEIKKFYKLDSTEILVISDDIDLPCGKVRFRESGSAGTHNGLRNIVLQIGENFKRVRIGTGRTEGMDLADFVLSKISGEQKQKIEIAFNEACDKILEQINA